ncbi:MAG: hypothetical protein ABWK05_03790 [Pyrobaculum sp.]
MEELKEALMRLLREDRRFLRDLVLEAISGDDSAAEEIVKLILNSPKAKAELLGEVAGGIAVPLNVATKDDLKQFATKKDLRREFRRLENTLKDIQQTMATREDLKRLEDKMATKEQIEDITMTVEEEARETVKWLLRQRGLPATRRGCGSTPTTSSTCIVRLEA